jgi:hypothetical protein
MRKAIWSVKSLASALLITAALTVAQQSQPTDRTTVSHGPTRLRPDEGLFNPDHKKALSYRDGEVVITLVNGKKNLAVEIETASQPKGRVELPSEIVQVNEIRGTQRGKAIVIGMVSGSVFETLVINTHPASIADSFLAYAPTVSPDGRFIAFVKFYPAHFVEGTDDHYLLYDVSRSAAENRPTNNSLADHTSVGIPVYPHVANQDGDNTGVPEQQRHHMLAQGFFWRSDSGGYAFADDHAGEWNVFMVSMSEGVPSTSKVTVARNELCAPLRSETCQATLSEAELIPLGLLAKFRGVGADSALEQIIQYRYQQFSTAQ